MAACFLLIAALKPVDTRAATRVRGFPLSLKVGLVAGGSYAYISQISCRRKTDSGMWAFL